MGIIYKRKIDPYLCVLERSHGESDTFHVDCDVHVEPEVKSETIFREFSRDQISRDPYLLWSQKRDWLVYIDAQLRIGRRRNFLDEYNDSAKVMKRKIIRANLILRD